MLKELWILIKMLFTEKPSDMLKRNDLEVVVMNHFPFSGFRYMMWCGKVICRPTKEAVIHRFLSMIAGTKACTHEHGHGMQAESEHGDNYVRYYLNYYWHWFKHLFSLVPLSACYYVNRYEVEAYAQEDHPEYWRNYTRENLRGKYTIKNARKKWKELGGKSSAWKAYVKSL
ncbi:MAG: hypothetical protein IJZ60_04780 [Bacteroides sp.]|nr:hypothetical protein [Bacteroides sp.]